MRHRRSLLLLGCGLGAAAVWVALTRQPAPPPPADPQPFLPGPLAKYVRNSGRLGFHVRLTFELALTPTADPLVFEYRPGRPAELVPVSHRVVFEHPPADCSKPVTVVGTVSAFEPDTTIRLSGVPGVVVVTAAAIAR